MKSAVSEPYLWRVQLRLSSGGENDLRIQQELIQSFTSYVIDYNFVQCSFTNKLFKIFYKQVSLTPLDQIMG